MKASSYDETLQWKHKDEAKLTKKGKKAKHTQQVRKHPSFIKNNSILYNYFVLHFNKNVKIHQNTWFNAEKNYRALLLRRLKQKMFCKII